MKRTLLPSVVLAALCAGAAGFIAPEQPDFSFTSSEENVVPADGYLGDVVVPELPERATLETHDLRYAFSWTVDVEGGGENRSDTDHPGVVGGDFDGAHMMVVARFKEDGPPPGYAWGINSALPWSSTGRAFKDWGPTVGNPTGPWPEVEKWPRLYDNDNEEDPGYWGPGSPVPPGPYTWGDVIQDDWVAWNEVEPGDVLSIWLPHRWELPDWPEGHQWPWAARVNTRVTLDLEWVPSQTQAAAEPDLSFMSEDPIVYEDVIGMRQGACWTPWYETSPGVSIASCRPVGPDDCYLKWFYEGGGWTSFPWECGDDVHIAYDTNTNTLSIWVTW